MRFRTFLNGPVLAIGLALSAAPGFARSGGEAAFYEAFYLEQVKADWSAAAKLYEKVAADRQAPDELRAEARARLAACAEELAASDFARLMPPNALAYIELNRPGDQINRLLASLGMSGVADPTPAAGTRRVAVSPALIKELLGVRGLAVAITGFDPQKKGPTGVAVLHPGNVDALRGLIESGLPAGGTAVEPIGGHATYDVEGEVLVTLTSRMVIASSERGLIEGVISRLSGKEKQSLATSATITEALGDRSDALIAFFVNAKPIMPMVKGMIAGQAGAQELAMADSLLDLDSLQSISGRVGVSEDGLDLNVALRLDEGHRNLVFNFLRSPAIDQKTLQCVPSGVAAFIVGALNDAESSFSAGPKPKPGDPPVVTALDFGREIFANITSAAVFVLPPTGEPGSGGMPIPDIAAAIRVNDPARSEALWTTILGVAGLATGKPVMEGERTDIAGASVRSYSMPENVNLYFTTLGNDVLVASTRSAMARTIDAKRKGESVTTDAAFASSLLRLNEKSIDGVFVHAGRMAQVARQYMPPGELAELQPVFDALKSTVASLVVDHSDRVFAISVGVSGIPDIGDLVDRQLTMEANRHRGRATLTRAVTSEDWNAALTAVEAQLEQQPGDAGLMRTRFTILAAGVKDVNSARQCADALFVQIGKNAKELNSFAWALLTEDQYGGRFDDVALRFSQRSNELTEYENWAHLDTLAWAKFKTGDADAAVRLEKKAIERSKGRSAEALNNALARFEKAANERKVATNAEHE